MTRFKFAFALAVCTLPIFQTTGSITMGDSDTESATMKKYIVLLEKSIEQADRIKVQDAQIVQLHQTIALIQKDLKSLREAKDTPLSNKQAITDPARKRNLATRGGTPSSRKAESEDCPSKHGADARISDSEEAAGRPSQPESARAGNATDAEMLENQSGVDDGTLSPWTAVLSRCNVGSISSLRQKQRDLLENAVDEFLRMSLGIQKSQKLYCLTKNNKPVQLIPSDLEEKFMLWLDIQIDHGLLDAPKKASVCHKII